MGAWDGLSVGSMGLQVLGLGDEDRGFRAELRLGRNMGFMKTNKYPNIPIMVDLKPKALHCTSLTTRSQRHTSLTPSRKSLSVQINLV